MKNPYEVLGVEKTATLKEIQKAYKQLAKKYHPDQDSSPEATEKFKEVVEAYDILKDPEKRRNYDNPPRFGRGGFNPESFFDFFNMAQAASSSRDYDDRVHIQISLEEVASGCKKSVQLPLMEICNKCNGAGLTKFDTCTVCSGSGIGVQQHGQWAVKTRCVACAGQGKINIVNCDNCIEGLVTTGHEDLSIPLPQGIESGTTFCMRGKGEFYVDNSKIMRGNLFVTVMVDDHPFFQRQHLNLFCEIPVNYTTLALGGELVVPSFYGDLFVKIPAGTKDGSTRKLKSQGLKSGNFAGDLLFSVKCHVPENASAEYLAKLEELKQLELSNMPEEVKKYIRQTNEQ